MWASVPWRIPAREPPRAPRERAGRPGRWQHLGSVACRLTLAASLGAACQTQPSAPVDPEPAPARQFVLRGVHFEERRDGGVLWSGTGQRADGDLSAADVTDLTLVRHAQNSGQTEFTLRAPAGHLAFDAGEAVFTQARVSEPGGGVLTAQRTRYDEEAGTLVAEGPIDFGTPTLSVTATAATVWLRQGTVEIAGPVQGELRSLRHGDATRAPRL